MHRRTTRRRRRLQTMDASMDHLTLTLLAHLGAHRRLLINLYASAMMRESQPVSAARELRETFARAPTRAPEGGSGLDPAVSDLLAAMTDEMIEEILDRVVRRVEQLCSETEDAAVTARPPKRSAGLFALDLAHPPAPYPGARRRPCRRAPPHPASPGRSR
jgi:hypothetical protein